MLNKCDSLVTEYLDWLREHISISELEEGCEITTPFLDRHNDYLQLYVMSDENQFILSDDGYILSDLRMSGVDINTEKRQDALNTILRGFGVKNENDVLRVQASKKNLAHKKHSLLQAMLAVNDLFLLAQPRIISFFVEDVEQYLRLNKVRYLPKVNLVGHTGYTHHFDFAIPASDQAPERLIKAINSPTRNSIMSYIFSWNDTRGERDSDSQAFAFLNDIGNNVSAESISALHSYNITPVPWSRREENTEALVA